MKNEKAVQLSEIKNGKTFKIGDVVYIKFSDIDGVTTAVTKEPVFRSGFGSNNNLHESKILKRLQEEFLPAVIKVVGEENVCEFETDLTTLDGLKPYEPLKSKISLPTFDFYRANVEIFDKHKVDSWWWLATPDTAQPHYDPIWIRCVSPRGSVNIGYYFYNRGVRPILNFVSSIFVSED